MMGGRGDREGPSEIQLTNNHHFHVFRHNKRESRSKTRLSTTLALMFTGWALRRSTTGK